MILLTPCWPEPLLGIDILTSAREFIKIYRFATSNIVPIRWQICAKSSLVLRQRLLLSCYRLKGKVVRKFVEVEDVFFIYHGIARKLMVLVMESYSHRLFAKIRVLGRVPETLQNSTRHTRMERKNISNTRGVLPVGLLRSVETL